MRNLLIVLWLVAVITGGVIGYLNRDILDCQERTYVRHGIEFKATKCVVVNK